ncbi:MAG: transketolase [Egibacteraceae bacterium]
MTATAPVLDSGALRCLAERARITAARLVASQGLGYLGQVFSSADILAVCLGRFLRRGKDRFVLSPSHYATAVYAVGAELGLLNASELADYGRDGSSLETIGTERTPLVDYTCGSLGQGLSVAIGLSLADRLKGLGGRTYVLVSDGEMEEGQLWEAAMFAAHHRLSRLVVAVDCNESQVDGPIATVTTVEPIADKWRAFGWYVQEVDGHDTAALVEAFEAAPPGDLPTAIIARTSMTAGLTSLRTADDTHFMKVSEPFADSVIRELEQRLPC